MHRDQKMNGNLLRRYYLPQWVPRRSLRRQFLHLLWTFGSFSDFSMIHGWLVV
jgi:hypothetical protein